MDCYLKKIKLTLVFASIALTSFASGLPGVSGAPNAGDPAYGFSDEEVVERLKQLEFKLVEAKFTPVVRAYLKRYLTVNRKRTESMLGKTVMYFPIFEKYLQENELPLALKYLPLVESALQTKAVSRVGAVGLWQFMPLTGRSLGLRIDDLVDERRDPYRSTEAAMEYIERNYARFGDWALTLAAYNSGSGRVSRAIKRSRSKNYWNLSRYLPRETRNYVPAFIAASYIAEFYRLHDLKPEYPQLDLQLTETITVYDEHNFNNIALATGLAVDLIDMLNPWYKKGVIPENPEGFRLILPRRVMPAFRDYLNTRRPDNDGENPEMPTQLSLGLSNGGANSAYLRTLYIVNQGETLEGIARLFHCTIHQLKAWNRLETNKLKVGQELVVYHPKDFARFPAVEKMEALESLPNLSKEEVLPLQPIPGALAQIKPDISYVTLRKEKLSNIAGKIPGLDLDDLLEINNLEKDKKVAPGTRLILHKVE